ncbi:MAG: ATP-binding protein [Erysipelotrichaceae bacterium]|nr:ATP-binding protein [Erysipelotrichaceae bacterium]
MNNNNANTKMLTKLMFSLLPVQILLAAVDSLDCFVSSYFASNFVGVTAMSAVGLYSPINLFVGALSLILAGGTSIICGKYLGRNEHEKLQNVFSLNLMVTFTVSAVLTIVFIVLGSFDLTGFLTSDMTVRPIFNSYLIGLGIGLLPNILTNQLPVFLSIENMNRRTLASSIIYVVSTVILNFLFVQVMHLEAFGLALASSVGNWIFFAVQIQYFLSGRSDLKVRLKKPDMSDAKEIVTTGLPGAASNVYQTLRGLIVNRLIEVFVGSIGISAFATADNLLRIFWAIPSGMLTVSRLLISVSIGEEDRQTLTDVMRVMFRRFVPLMGAVSAMIILFSRQLTMLFYQNTSDPVFMMTVWGLRILPLCMPLSIICMHFVCYAQASGKQFLIHILSLLDGVVCVTGFTAILISSLGIKSVYVANVLNGIVTTITIILYAWNRNRSFPRKMDELMVIPDDFGFAEDERLDLSISSIEEVVRISQTVQDFCLKKGIDERRSYLAGLSLEEMAGNVVEHGFTKDRKKHSVDVRVVHKDKDVILRIKDDCVPFDPNERRQMLDKDDPTKNVGIRMIYKIAQDVQYQNMLGLNVLTIRI